MSDQNPGGYSLRQGTKRNYKEMNSGQKYRLPTKKKSNHHVGHYRLKRPRGGIPPGPQNSSLSHHDVAQSPSTDLNPFITSSTIVVPCPWIVDMFSNPFKSPTPYDIINDKPVYLSKEDKYVYLPEYDQCVSLQSHGTSYTITLKDKNRYGRNLTLKQRGVLRLCDLSDRDKRSIDYLRACGSYCELTGNDNSTIEPSDVNNDDMGDDIGDISGDNDDDAYANSQSSFNDQYNQLMEGGDSLDSLNHNQGFLFQLSPEDEKIIVNDICVHHGLKLPLPPSFINHIYGMNKVVSEIPDCLDTIQRHRTTLHELYLAIESGVPLKTAEGLAFFSIPLNKSSSSHSLKEWREKILSVCQSIGGSLFITFCQRCKQYMAGAFIFCSHCSEDGHPIRLLHGCSRKDCWCNDDFFTKNCQSFLVKDHIGEICCHRKSKAYDGYPFVSPLECIIMLCISNYGTRLQNCRRSDLLLNAIHCEHTNQIIYAMSLNAASILGYFGEFLIAKRILKSFSSIVPVERMDHPLGTVFTDFYTCHQWPYYYGPLDTPPDPTMVTPPDPTMVTPPDPTMVTPPDPTMVTPPDPTMVTPPDPTMVTPPDPTMVTQPNYRNDTLFSSQIGDSYIQNIYTIHSNGIASPHVTVMDAINSIVNDEKNAKKNHVIETNRIDIPGDCISNTSEYKGPMFTEPLESVYDCVSNRVRELETEYGRYYIGHDEEQTSCGSKKSTIQFSYPNGERVEDMYFFVTLHADDKPTTPFSEKSLSHCIISLRILNGNPADVSSPAFTHPLCIIPKPEEEDSHHSWNSIVEGVFDAILFHTVAVGISGVYVSTQSGWKHVRWGVVSISGDTVGEEQISGYVNKSKSRFSCIYSSICKNDHFSPDNWIFCDMSHSMEKYNRELTCSSHALRCFHPGTAVANLGAVAACQLSDNTSVFEGYKDSFPFLSDYFVNEAHDISFFLNSFKLQNTVFWTPFSPSHPVLRQLLNAKIVQMQHMNIPRSKSTKDVSLRFPVNTQRWDEPVVHYLPSSIVLKDLTGLDISDNSIVKFSVLRISDITWFNHPLITRYDGTMPYCRRCIGPMDTLDYKPQWKRVCDSMLVPLQGVFAMDEMHLAANVVYWITDFLTGSFCKPSEFSSCFVNTIRHVFKTDNQCLLSLPMDIQAKANNRLNIVKQRLFPDSKYITLDANGMRHNKVHDLIVFAFGCFDFIFQDSRSNFLVYCILEILNLFGILFTASIDTKDIMRVQSLLSFLLACIEGKTIPKSIPTVHRTSHLGDGIICTGSLSYVDNFYVEFSYSYLGRNLYQSRNPEVTCVINLRLLSAIRILLGPVTNIPFFSSVTNASDCISFPSTFSLLNQVENSLRSVTKANVVDDHGFFCNQILYRHTFLDEPIRGENEAKRYYRTHTPSGFTISLHSIKFSFYRVCRWRDRRIHYAANLSETISPQYLLENERSIVFTMNERKRLCLYINIGFNLCFVNKIPYVQALCFPIAYETYHLLSSSYSSVYIPSSFNMDVTQIVPSVISLYRLHMEEVRVLPNYNGSCYIVLTSLYHSMSISMSDCWELQPDLARNNYCYEYDLQLKEGIKSCKKRKNGKEVSYCYNNRELRKQANVDGDLALNTKEDELLKHL